jgi:DNA-binding LacI/PurR family transcriptional regulator
VDVPAELSIIGFDDVDVARATAPALTTVRQPLRELGRVAARTVLVDGDRQMTVLQPELIERDSVAPPSALH